METFLFSSHESENSDDLNSVLDQVKATQKQLIKII